MTYNEYVIQATKMGLEVKSEEHFNKYFKEAEKVFEVIENVLDVLMDDKSDYERGVEDGRKQVQDDIDATEKVNEQLRNSQSKFGIGEAVFDTVTNFSGFITAITTTVDGDFYNIENEHGIRTISEKRLETVQ